ncbi:MAG: YjbQ family protein [candidate division Zixibacteria bacterium]|nr:YjbQ family protein [candidate division Zixibacteria bacterium]
MLKEISLKTSNRTELIDITSQVESFLREAGVESGIIVIYTRHTTAGVTINEDADPSVRKDIDKFLRELIPVDWGFSHAEGNSDAHLKSTLVGASETVIIDGSKLLLGRWQGIYFCEFDGPRSRTVYLKIMPE